MRACQQNADRHESYDDRIYAEVLYWTRRASDFYGKKIDAPNVSFDLKGKTAGMLRWRSRGKAVISTELRFNVPLISENWEDSLKRTIPHEVAHYVVVTVWGVGRRSHGPEWKAVMEKCFKLEAKRCHSYDVSNHGRKRKPMARPFAYKCQCRVHNLTSIRHNRARSGRGKYHCLFCKAPLVFSGQFKL